VIHDIAALGVGLAVIFTAPRIADLSGLSLNAAHRLSALNDPLSRPAEGRPLQHENQAASAGGRPYGELAGPAGPAGQSGNYWLCESVRGSLSVLRLPAFARPRLIM
jgi:hypothetical protein